MFTPAWLLSSVRGHKAHLRPLICQEGLALRLSRFGVGAPNVDPHIPWSCLNLSPESTPILEILGRSSLSGSCLGHTGSMQPCKEAESAFSINLCIMEKFA